MLYCRGGYLPASICPISGDWLTFRGCYCNPLIQLRRAACARRHGAVRPAEIHNDSRPLQPSRSVIFKPAYVCNTPLWTPELLYITWLLTMRNTAKSCWFLSFIAKFHKHVVLSQRAGSPSRCFHLQPLWNTVNQARPYKAKPHESHCSSFMCRRFDNLNLDPAKVPTLRQHREVGGRNKSQKKCICLHWGGISPHLDSRNSAYTHQTWSFFSFVAGLGLSFLLLMSHITANSEEFFHCAWGKSNWESPEEEKKNQKKKKTFQVCKARLRPLVLRLMRRENGDPWGIRGGLQLIQMNP